LVFINSFSTYPVFAHFSQTAARNKGLRRSILKECWEFEQAGEAGIAANRHIHWHCSKADEHIELRPITAEDNMAGELLAKNCALHNVFK